MKNYFLKILCKILQKCGIFELAKLKNCKINNLTQHIPHLDKSKTTNWCTLSFIITISILLTRVWGIWTIVITLKQRHVELCNQSTQDFLFKRFGRNEKKEITSLPYFGVKLSCVCLMFAYRNKTKRLLYRCGSKHINTQTHKHINT